MNLNFKSCTKALALAALAALAVAGVSAPASAACGKGKISAVAGGVSTVSGGNQFWNVLPGTTVTITLTCATECKPSTIPAGYTGAGSLGIQVIVQSSASGNYCTWAKLDATTAGKYCFTYPVPAGGCQTSIISYCTSNCSTSTGYTANDANGTCSGHLRVATVAGGVATDCKPTITGPNCGKSVDLGCLTADPSITAANAATLAGGVTGSNCGAPLVPSVTLAAASGTNCARSRVVTFTAANDCGVKATCVVTFKWSVHTAPVFDNLPTGGNIPGCNPARPTCASVTAHDNCQTGIVATCKPGDVTNVGACGKTQTFTYCAKNCAGQSVSADVTYTWKEDTTPPSFDNLPVGGDLGCNPTLPSCDPTVTATDLCDGKVDVHCSAGAIIGAAFHTATAIPYAAKGYKYLVVAHGIGAGFEAPGFDDSAYSVGDAGFGDGCGDLPKGTDWTVGTDILVRKSFHLPPGAKNVTVGVAIDNDVQVFVNGVDVSGGVVPHENCATRDSFVFNVPDNVLQSDNVIAVRGIDRGVTAYLDLQVNFDDPCELTQTFTYSAKDSCENPISQDVTYMWSVGTVKITCPQDANICLKDYVPGDTDLTGTATAVTSCNRTADVNFVDSEHTPFTCPTDSTAGFTFTRTWTATSLCGTDTCSQLITVCACNPSCVPFGQGCTVTLGFWKTHGPGLCVQGKNKNVWPVGDIWIGCQKYNTVTDAAAICSLLSDPGQHLIPQLIAAQLNLLNNAGDPGNIQAVITAANACLCAGTDDCTGFTTALDNYNSGVTGPGHCGTCP